MRPGGGAPKGSGFERDIAVTLSLWLSHGARKDLICRTGGSGGQYTNSAKRGTPQFQPGDLMAVDSAAYEFCKKFTIECKHWKDLGMIQFLYGKGDLYDAMEKVKGEARTRNSSWMLIVKQNNRKTLLFTPTGVNESDLVVKEILPYRKIEKWHRTFPLHMRHLLFHDTVYMFLLDEFLIGFSPEELLDIQTKGLVNEDNAIQPGTQT